MENIIFDSGGMLAEAASCFLRIACACIAGIILGLERKFRQQSVGMRTLILICVSSCLIMMISISAAHRFGGDSMRLAAQVVSGIGFLGTGAIIRYGLNVKGLTSAGIIWTAAAIGLAVGAEMYIESLTALAVCVISLIVLEKVEDRFFPADHIKCLHLVFSVTKERPDIIGLQELLLHSGLLLADMNISENLHEHEMSVSLTLKSPKILDISLIISEIAERYTLLKYKFSS